MFQAVNVHKHTKCITVFSYNRRRFSRSLPHNDEYFTIIACKENERWFTRARYNVSTEQRSLCQRFTNSRRLRNYCDGIFYVSLQTRTISIIHSMYIKLNYLKLIHFTVCHIRTRPFYLARTATLPVT